MKTITGPDGIDVDFPDDMSDEAIAQVFRKQFGGPTTEPAETAPVGIEAIPGIGKYLKAFNDFTGNVQTGFADMATFGTADEINAAINAPLSDKTYDQLLEDGRKRLANSGTAGTIGQAIGAVMLPAGAAKTIPQAIGMGALQGGAYGFGSGEGGVENRLENAAIGAGVGGAIGGVANKLGKALAPKKVDDAAIETLDGLKNRETQEFKNVISNAPKLTSSQVDDVATKATDKFDELFKRDNDVYATAPAEVKKLVQDLNTISKNGNGIHPGILYDMSKDLGGSITHQTSKTEKAQILGMKSILDDAVNTAMPQLDDAKGIFKQYKKAELLDDAINAAKVQSETSTAANGLAVGKAVKKQMADIYKKIQSGELTGFKPEEVDLIKQAATAGTFWGDRVKDVGALVNPTTLRGALSNPFNWMDAAGGLATGGMSNLATLPLRAGAGHLIVKAGEKMNEKSLRKAIEASQVVRSGLSQKDLPKLKNGITKSILQALMEKANSPYVAAVGAYDLNKEE
jgi:hypothetical protein